MLKFKDNGIIVELSYSLPKHNPNALWVDFAKYKNIPKMKFSKLVFDLKNFAYVFGESGIKKVDILLSGHGCTWHETNGTGFNFRCFVMSLEEIVNHRGDLFVEKCFIELIKPLEYQWFEKPKQKKKSKNKRKAIPNHIRVHVLERDNYTCQMCGRTVKDGVSLHIDHCIPVSKGGDNSPDNLQVLCSDCNHGKHNKDYLKHDERKRKELKRYYEYHGGSK